MIMVFTDALWFMLDLLFGTGPAPVYEDEPGWNCLTMGNGVCGTPQS